MINFRTPGAPRCSIQDANRHDVLHRLDLGKLHGQAPRRAPIIVNDLDHEILAPGLADETFYPYLHDIMYGTYV